MDYLDSPIPVLADDQPGEIVSWLYLMMPDQRKELHAVVRTVEGDGPVKERAVPIWRFRMRRDNGTHGE